jgi:hypothetical protein
MGPKKTGANVSKAKTPLKASKATPAKGKKATVKGTKVW